MVIKKTWRKIAEKAKKAEKYSTQVLHSSGQCGKFSASFPDVFRVFRGFIPPASWVFPAYFRIIPGAFHRCFAPKFFMQNALDSLPAPAIAHLAKIPRFGGLVMGATRPTSNT
jgi:hypothetical protein